MFAQVASAVEQRFASQWATAHPTIPVLYDSSDQQIGAGDTHLTLSILFGPTERKNIGSYKNHRLYGIISINILVKKGTGTRTSLGYADTAATIFRDEQFSGVLCRSPYVKRIGLLDEWMAYNVSTPFQYDEAYT